MGLFGKATERRKVKRQVDKLMKQYDKRKINGATYAQRMMELASSSKKKK